MRSNTWQTYNSHCTISGSRRLVFSACALLLTALLFLPSYFIAPVYISQESAGETKPPSGIAIFHVPELTEIPKETSATIANIYAWTELKNPYVLIMPNAILGFSKYAGDIPPYKYFTYPEQEIEWAPEPDIPMPEPEVYEENVTSMRRLMNMNWKTYSRLDVPPAPVHEMPTGILWADMCGKRIINPPEINIDAAREIVNGRSPMYPTRLEAVISSSGKLYRVIVRQTCGNSDLDQMAVSALKLRLNTIRHAAQFDSSIKLQQQIALQIFWHL